jgi:ABC-type multidrug transport system ATPase subunit
LLDEPTAGVDARARREFWDLIHDLAADGLTVLVSTHYMDEAERCGRVVCISGGRMVAEGAPDQVASGSGVVVLAVSGADLDRAAGLLRGMAGVESAAVFGSAIHVAGTDRVALERAVAAFDGGRLTWHEAPPRLEDVFIHLLGRPGGQAQ